MKNLRTNHIDWQPSSDDHRYLRLKSPQKEKPGQMRWLSLRTIKLALTLAKFVWEILMARRIKHKAKGMPNLLINTTENSRIGLRELLIILSHRWQLWTNRLGFPMDLLAQLVILPGALENKQELRIHHRKRRSPPASKTKELLFRIASEAPKVN